MSNNSDPWTAWAIIILFFVVFGTASVIACWCCLYHTCLKPCGVGPWGAESAIASPDDGRSVNPIFSTRGSRLYPPNNTGSPGCSDIPTALRNRDGNVIEDVKKIQKQLKDLLLKQEIESKKQYEEIQNQTKQLNVLQNLVLDPKNSQSSKRKAEKVVTELPLPRQHSLWTAPNCVVCLDKPLTHAVRPCGHFIACTDCAEKLPKECPICRRTISDTLRIFFP